MLRAARRVQDVPRLDILHFDKYGIMKINYLKSLIFHNVELSKSGEAARR